MTPVPRTTRRAAVFAAALVAVVALGAARAAAEEPVRHRFLALDESRSQLHYVDQLQTGQDWTLQLPGRTRDLQLVGGHRVLLSTGNGCQEYDLRTRELVKEVADPRFEGTLSVRRLATGHTIICCAGGKKLFELDPGGQVIREATFPAVELTRLVRLTPEGTVLMGATEDKLIEVALDGRIIREMKVPGARCVYQALRLPDGRLLVATGYSATVEELAAAGQRVWKAGGLPAPEGMYFLFFAGFQVLPSGDVVVSTWTGHGADDSRKGPQLVQFNRAGDIVWQWHDPERAGSIHGVIVMDDLDPAVLNDDCAGVLGAVTR